MNMWKFTVLCTFEKATIKNKDPGPSKPTFLITSKPTLNFCSIFPSKICYVLHSLQIMFLSSLILTVTLLCKLGVLFQFYTWGERFTTNRIAGSDLQAKSSSVKNTLPLPNTATRAVYRVFSGHTYTGTPPSASSLPQSHL